MFIASVALAQPLMSQSKCAAHTLMQVPDEQPVSEFRFPDDAQNHRHFPGGPVRATDAAVAKDGSMQNGAAHVGMQNGATPGTPPGSPKVEQRRSSSTEAAEAVMQRTEL
jgi:hypothetical protein